MFDSRVATRSDDPQSMHLLYIVEKNYFAGAVIGAIFYGVVIVLFFRCMGVLLHPVYCAREGVKWGLVVYATAAFSFVTIFTATSLHMKSISYVDNRGFPGNDAPLAGPREYENSISSKAIYIVPNFMFCSNNWLADGVLLYRCCVIYSMNWRVVSVPCAMYLASLVMGIMFTYYLASPIGNWSSVIINFRYPYFAISLSLNIVLTLMIVVRLVLCSRDIRNAVGPSVRTTGLYKTISTALIESLALYTVSFLLFIIPWSAGGSVAGIFFPVLANTQVIAPFLLILRVADQRVLAGDGTGLGSGGSIRFRSQESTGESMPPPNGHFMSSMGTDDDTRDSWIPANDGVTPSGES